MKISPIDIRQHTFEKGFRGYEVDEVNAFLNSLSQEWERVMQENKMLKMQLEIAEKELNKLRDVEMTLFRTLKTAEDTSTQITEQANKAAEKYLQESRRQTDETMNDTKRKASMIVQDAENQARYVREEILNEMKNQERDFKAMEKYRDNLVVQLKSLVNNTNETVERFEKKFSGDSSFADHMEKVKEEVATSITEKQGPPTDETDTDFEEAPIDVDALSESQLALETADVDAEDSGETTRDSDASASESEEKRHEARGSDQDAASEAMAEVEKMASLRKSATTDEARESDDAAESASENSKEKGSFFDQIS